MAWVVVLNSAQQAFALEEIKAGVYFCEIPSYMDGSSAKKCMDGDGTERECLGYKMILEDSKLFWNAGNETGVWKEIHTETNTISGASNEEAVIGKVFGLYVNEKPRSALMTVSPDLRSPNNLNVFTIHNYRANREIKNMRLSGPNISHTRCEFMG